VEPLQDSGVGQQEFLFFEADFAPEGQAVGGGVDAGRRCCVLSTGLPYLKKTSAQMERVLHDFRPEHLYLHEFRPK
jgi:hypothetical protein